MNTPPASLAPEAETSGQQPSLVRGLSLLDSVLLLVSGIIGSSIFLTAKDIAGPLPNPTLFFLVWVLGGVISLCACVAFAELGSMFPDSGGQYIYLREAYGDLVAFLYGWMLFTVGNGGSIAALSVASAAYMGNIIPFISQRHVIFSLAGMPFTRAHAIGLVLIAILTCVNVFGLRWGALLTNVSTWTKFSAMAVFVVLGFAIGKGHWSNFSAHAPGGLTMGLSAGQLISAFGVGLIAVFWAYDGWVYITWVAGEVKDPRRNVPLAMVLGVLAVGTIYLAMNMVYVYAMPLNEIAKYETIAHAAATNFVLQRGGGLHPVGFTCLSRHGTRRRFLSPHGRHPSQVADARLQPNRPRHLGRGSHHERTLRPALYLRHLWHGALVHADRHRAVRFALETTRRSPPIPLHRIPMAARDLYSGRGYLDPQHNYPAAD